MNSITTLCTKTAILAVMLFAIAACDSNDGPLEKAGQSIQRFAQAGWTRQGRNRITNLTTADQKTLRVRHAFRSAAGELGCSPQV